jgi:hypothetical protein
MSFNKNNIENMIKFEKIAMKNMFGYESMNAIDVIGRHQNEDGDEIDELKVLKTIGFNTYEVIDIDNIEEDKIESLDTDDSLDNKQNENDNPETKEENADSINENEEGSEAKDNDLKSFDPGFLTPRSTRTKGELTIFPLTIKEYGDNFDKNIKRILTFVSDYIKRNLTLLSSRGPGRHLLFSKNDEYTFLTLCGVNEEVFKGIIKKSKYINPKWIHANKVIDMIFPVLISYFYSKMAKKDVNITNEDRKKSPPYIINLLFTLKFYSALVRKYFKYEPDEELMAAMIDDMSKRYLLKGLNNVFSMLEYLSFTNIDNMQYALLNPTDENLYYFMTNLFNRLSSMLKLIANEFYKKYEQGKTTTVETTTSENEEGQTKINISSNISNDIDNITRKLLIRISSESTIDETCLKIACKQTKIGYDKMSISLNKMRENDPELVGRLISLILSYYLGILKQPRSSIRSSRYILLMQKSYNVSNTADRIILDIKDILDVLLKKYSPEYLKTSRKASLSNLKTTVYLYWMIYINKYSE